MNPAVLQALMGGRSLDEFIHERGEAIREIGLRRRYSLKTVNVDGHLHTPLYPAWEKKRHGTPHKT